MKRVVIESPFAGDTERNLAYLRDAIRDCLTRGEAPYASHGFFPGVLDDNDPAQRTLGIEAGLVWGEAAELVAVYDDLGVSPGMRLGIERHTERGVPVEHRSLLPWALDGTARALVAHPEFRWQIRMRLNHDGNTYTVVGVREDGWVKLAGDGWGNTREWYNPKDSVPDLRDMATAGVLLEMLGVWPAPVHNRNAECLGHACALALLANWGPGGPA